MCKPAPPRYEESWKEWELRQRQRILERDDLSFHFGKMGVLCLNWSNCENAKLPPRSNVQIEDVQTPADVTFTTRLSSSSLPVINNIIWQWEKNCPLVIIDRFLRHKNTRTQEHVRLLAFPGLEVLGFQWSLSLAIQMLVTALIFNSCWVEQFHCC